MPSSGSGDRGNWGINKLCIYYAGQIAMKLALDLQTGVSWVPREMIRDLLLGERALIQSRYGHSTAHRVSTFTNQNLVLVYSIEGLWTLHATSSKNPVTQARCYHRKA